MKEKQDFHIKADKAMSVKAKELSGLSNRELYELGCKVAIEQNRNVLDTEILELHDARDKVNELTKSIRSRLKDKEVPTKPSDDENDPDELKRNILPLDLFKEMVLYYMDDFDITDLQELGSKNKEIFRFVLINLAHYEITMEELNQLYADMNSE
ncbi:MAG: hypothetical protein IJP99_10370 [Methanobrevibacter sp.]|nr:hypothetical protein [Methanobrevibacter sp.]